MRKWLICLLAFFIPVAATAVWRALPGGTEVVSTAASPWKANYFPNVPVVTQDGKTFKFYDDLLKGKIAVFSFIFTGCSQLCPLTTARLAEVQKQLGDAVGRDVFFYTVTLDPEHDDPAALKKFAANFHIGPGWQFLTGKPDDIKLIRDRLGERSRVMTEHQAQIVLGNDATGEWGKDSAMSDIDHIVMTIHELDPKWRAAQHQAMASASGDAGVAFKDAPGQSLFIKLCSSCHTVGRGDKIGPDLSGVTGRRDPAWLKKFIVSAEKMRQAGDPTALELFEKFNHVQMPNLGLVEVDAVDVISYIERESARLKEAAAKAPTPAASAPQ